MLALISLPPHKAHWPFCSCHFSSRMLRSSDRVGAFLVGFVFMIFSSKMVKSCVAFGCENRDTEENRKNGISFHRFPKDHDRRQAWIVAVRRENFKPIDESRLCSAHFKQDDFKMNSNQVKSLKPGTVPSVFSKFPSHLQPKEVKN